MKTLLTLALGLLLFATSAPALEARKERRLLIAQYQGQGGNRIVELGADGRVTWEHPVPSLCVIFQRLPNGNVVYAYGGKPTGVQEVDRDHRIVWNHVSKCPQVLSCERLANGNTLVGEQGPCQAVEISPAGQVVATVPLPTTEKPFHQQLRNIHALPDGHLLAAIEAEGAAREVDAAGKVVWQISGLANVFEAIRLANGNTLVACGTQKRVIEVSPEGKTVWELTASDVPGVNLTWVTSLQVLKNGNYLIGNFLHGQEGKGAHAFEVTREKKVVWTFADHELMRSATMVRSIDGE